MNRRVRRRRCEDCGKYRYATAEAAEADLRRIAGISDHQTVPKRVYLGPCGWHHLTGKAVRSEHGHQVDMGRAS